MTAHLAVFGDLFDLPERACAELGDVHVSAFVQRSRVKACPGIDAAHTIIALPDNAPADQWAAVVRAVHTARPITHAAALVDHLTQAAATALADINVAFHSPETAENCCDKAAMRRILHRRNVYPVPHRVVADASAASSAAEQLGLPCVFKPLSATGSCGVTVVSDVEDVKAAYVAAAELGPDVLVEKFLAGPQYSVEAMSENGIHVVLAVTRKYSDPQSLVELGHVLPAPLCKEESAAIAECAVRLLDAVGLTYGPSHTEIVLTAAGPIPIETHARVGGDDIWLMVHAATGVDLDSVQPKQIFGQRILDDVRATLAGPRPQRPYQAVWFGAARTERTFTTLTVPPEIQRADHVAVTALREEGDQVLPLASSNDRVFKVRASGTSPAEALELARGAARAVAAASDLAVELTDLDATC